MTHPYEKTILGSVIQAGAEAATAKHVIGELLDTEMEIIITTLCNADPDLGVYAKLAGRAQTVRRLQNTLSMRVDDGNDALVELSKQGET